MDISTCTTKVEYGDDFEFDWTIEGSLEEIKGLTGQSSITSENLMSPGSQNIWKLVIAPITTHKRVHRKLTTLHGVKINLILIEHGHHRRPQDKKQYGYRLKSKLTYEYLDEGDDGDSESSNPPVEKSHKDIGIIGFKCTDMAIELFSLPEASFQRIRNIHIKGRIKSEPQMVNVNSSGDKVWETQKLSHHGLNKNLVEGDRGGKILSQILQDNPEDIEVICNGTKFKIHKHLLTAQSKVFAKMFQVNLSEKRKNRIVIEDFEPEIVQVFLNYLKNILTPTEIEQNVRGLFMLSHKYEIDDLKTHCEAILCRKIDLENAIEMLELGQLFDLFELEDSAMKFILSKKRLMDSLKAFDRLAQENPRLLASIHSEVWKSY